MNHTIQRLTPWICLAIMIATMAIFTGSIYPYLTSNSNPPIGYLPLLTGALLTGVLAALSTYRYSIKFAQRWEIALAAAVIAIVTYVGLSMFLILNVVGS